MLCKYSHVDRATRPRPDKHTFQKSQLSVSENSLLVKQCSASDIQLTIITIIHEFLAWLLTIFSISADWLLWNFLKLVCHDNFICRIAAECMCNYYPYFYFNWLIKFGSHTYSVRGFCFGRRVCRLLSVLWLSRVRSRKLREIRAKFNHPHKKSGSPNKNMTSDFAPEVDE